MSTKSNEESQVNEAVKGLSCCSTVTNEEQVGACASKCKLTSFIFYSVVLLGLGAAVLSILS